MDKDAYEKLLTELAQAHTDHWADFKRWYDHADFPTIEDYCEMGYLISRVLRPPESQS